MRLDIPHEQLTQLIRQYGAASAESTQIARRLKALIPTRLGELKQLNRSGASAASAERLALIDERYLDFLREYVDLLGHALEAKVQYETHLMLIDARRSLRAFRRNGTGPR